ncbi:RusA family crossover junction endodeoxyribonuclease [Priestia megaterium]
MRKTLIVPMMMFGRFRATVAKRDKNGDTIIKRRDSKGRPVYEKQKVWVVRREKDGDPGMYPSVNHIYERMAKGRQRLTEPAEQLKRKWETLAKMWAEEVAWHTTKGEKVVVELTAHFPADKKRRDTNNVFKLMMDAFTGIIYDDDEYALPRVMDFHRVAEGQKPYFELNIYLKSEEDAVMMERYAA